MIVAAPLANFVIRRLGGNADRQKVGGRLNNRAENSRRPFRLRERAMQRFRNMKTLQKIQFSSCPGPQPFTWGGSGQE
jgi:transposase-like protein